MFRSLRCGSYRLTKHSPAYVDFNDTFFDNSVEEKWKGTADDDTRGCAMKIILTGGGTAGHVIPNIALLKGLREKGYEISYIGSKTGVEKDMMEKEGVPYYGIQCGKLRRYLSYQNLLDPFRVVAGIFQAKKVIRKVKPDVIFSKGGFVSLPVVIAAGKTTVVAHESDYTPGLANKLAAPFCDKICVTFEDTLKYLKDGKGEFTGTPIREELYHGDRERGLRFTGFSGEKPVLLVMGGSSGALHMNELVREAVKSLLEQFDIIHLCGKGKVDGSFDYPGYVQYEYISEELPDLLALSDVIVSRSGANAVFEFLSLSKPAVLIPLPLSASRGDQILNAKYFVKKGYAEMLDQDTAKPEELVELVRNVYANRGKYIEQMKKDSRIDGTDEVLQVITQCAESRK